MQREWYLRQKDCPEELLGYLRSRMPLRLTDGYVILETTTEVIKTVEKIYPELSFLDKKTVLQELQRSVLALQLAKLRAEKEEKIQRQKESSGTGRHEVPKEKEKKGEKITPQPRAEMPPRAQSSSHPSERMTDELQAHFDLVDVKNDLSSFSIRSATLESTVLDDAEITTQDEEDIARFLRKRDFLSPELEPNQQREIIALVEGITGFARSALLDRLDKNSAIQWEFRNALRASARSSLHYVCLVIRWALQQRCFRIFDLLQGHFLWPLILQLPECSVCVKAMLSALLCDLNLEKKIQALLVQCLEGSLWRVRLNTLCLALDSDLFPDAGPSVPQLFTLCRTIFSAPMLSLLSRQLARCRNCPAEALSYISLAMRMYQSVGASLDSDMISAMHDIVLQPMVIAKINEGLHMPGLSGKKESLNYLKALLRLAPTIKVDRNQVLKEFRLISWLIEFVGANSGTMLYADCTFILQMIAGMDETFHRIVKQRLSEEESKDRKNSRAIQTLQRNMECAARSSPPRDAEWWGPTGFSRIDQFCQEIKNYGRRVINVFRRLLL